MISNEVTDGGIAGWVVALMEALGPPGVGLAIALESVFPPLPSELFLPLAGFAAARGEMSVPLAIAWSTAGSLVGALVLYGVGAALGRQRVWALAARMPLVDVRDVQRAEAWFARYGVAAVFLGRMVPLVRSLISVPAGIQRMRLPLFAVLTTAGSLVWNTAFVLAGYLLGANWSLVEPYADLASKSVLGLLVVAVVAFVVRRILSRRRAATAAASIGSAGMREGPEFDDTVEVPTVRLAVRPRPGSSARPAPDGRGVPSRPTWHGPTPSGRPATSRQAGAPVLGHAAGPAPGRGDDQRRARSGPPP